MDSHFLFDCVSQQDSNRIGGLFLLLYCFSLSSLLSHSLSSSSLIYLPTLPLSYLTLLISAFPILTLQLYNTGLLSIVPFLCYFHTNLLTLL